MEAKKAFAISDAPFPCRASATLRPVGRDKTTGFRCPGATRRDTFTATIMGGIALLTSDVVETPGTREQTSTSYSSTGGELPQLPVPEFAKPGPFLPVRLPRLEHTCYGCFPQCVGDRCLLRLDVVYPKGSKNAGVSPPYPLAVITGGFLVKGDEYISYAERLASWGYVAVLYDKVESVLDALDDVISASFIREIIDWSRSDPLLSQIVDPNNVYLIGHSRGGKVSVLAAEEDERVAALCLIDPVDNTVYAPEGPGFPSAVAALKSGRRSIPVAVIGSGLGNDCAPRESNYDKFFHATTDAAWEVVLKNAGHFQFLDQESALQKAVCVQGQTPDALVRYITQAVMVAWGETMIRDKNVSHLPATDDCSSEGASTFSRNSIASLLQNVQGLDLETRLKNFPQEGSG